MKRLTLPLIFFALQGATALAGEPTKITRSGVTVEFTTAPLDTDYPEGVIRGNGPKGSEVIKTLSVSVDGVDVAMPGEFFLDLGKPSKVEFARQPHSIMLGFAGGDASAYFRARIYIVPTENYMLAIRRQVCTAGLSEGQFCTDTFRSGVFAFDKDDYESVPVQ